MSGRPFLSKRIDDLRDLFRDGGRDPNVLKLLDEELKCRKTRGARDLLAEVEDALARSAKVPKKNRSQAHAPALKNSTRKIIREKPIPHSPARIPKEWDKEQRSVIEKDYDDYLVVEAGPGSGKTAVACARVASLIEDHGLTASKILLVSFTRTAVKELRDRIRSHSSDPDSVAGLKIVTLDSFTFEIVRGLGGKADDELLGGYDSNISSFLELLKKGEEELVDYLGELEHVVMDEGQDLVSVRADLALELIRALPKECGVTIFADSAQAIYGFTDDHLTGAKSPSRTLVERISDGEAGKFNRVLLEKNHRTSDERLRKLVSEGRKKLVDLRESKPGSWQATRELIEKHCHGRVKAADKEDLEGRSDTLVLYRSRAEVIMASSYLWGKGVTHAVRMSGIPPRVHPRIGRLLGGVTEDLLDRKGFENLCSERIGGSPASYDAMWELLLAHAGESNGRIQLLRLRELLARDRPPIDFLVDEAEMDGPVLGTIHASKGREADRVHLMLPPEDYLTSRKVDPTPPEIAEEERVLFVGATRARSFLFCGPGSKLGSKRLESGRIYRPTRTRPNARQIEVGLAGDIMLTSLADSSRPLREITRIQEWLWERRTTVLELESRYDNELGANVLWHVDGDKELKICSLSSQFSRDLFSVGKEVAKSMKCARCKPWTRIRNLRMVGVTTVVIPQAARDALRVPWRHSGFLLAPVITGFPLVQYQSYCSAKNK
jgi:hypothetical protein